jgi:dipeptidyl aminopeptidase/acylaminoacyl peptidase
VRFALIFLALTGASMPSQALGAPLRARPAADVCRTLQGSLFSFSERGAVFVSGMGGGTACRLSPSLAAKEPHLSPDGRAIAFLSGVGTGGNGAGATNSVRMLSLGGRREYRRLSTDGQLHGNLAWSPDGRALAFLDGNSLWIWRASCGCSSPAVRGSSQAPVCSFAWSTDSRHVAGFRQPQAQFPLARIPVYELEVRTGAVSTVWVDFPAGVGNPRTGAGSYPSRLLGWTATNRFLIGTSMDPLKALCVNK